MIGALMMSMANWQVTRMLVEPKGPNRQEVNMEKAIKQTVWEIQNPCQVSTLQDQEVPQISEIKLKSLYFAAWEDMIFYCHLAAYVVARRVGVSTS